MTGRLPAEQGRHRSFTGRSTLQSCMLFGRETFDHLPSATRKVSGRGVPGLLKAPAPCTHAAGPGVAAASTQPAGMRKALELRVLVPLRMEVEACRLALLVPVVDSKVTPLRLSFFSFDRRPGRPGHCLSSHRCRYQDALPYRVSTGPRDETCRATAGRSRRVGWMVDLGFLRPNYIARIGRDHERWSIERIREPGSMRHKISIVCLPDRRDYEYGHAARKGFSSRFPSPPPFLKTFPSTVSLEGSSLSFCFALLLSTSDATVR